MRALADFTLVPGDEGQTTVAFSGPMTVASVGAIDSGLRAVEGPVATVDLADIGEIDTVGAWVVWRFSQRLGARIVDHVRGQHEAARRPAFHKRDEEARREVLVAAQRLQLRTNLRKTLISASVIGLVVLVFFTNDKDRSLPCASRGSLATPASIPIGGWWRRRRDGGTRSTW